MITTKTIGPLHFEDLEPKRFEDLVRQLVYDFRPWRMLEATGRSGSDDGFDARGWEIITDSSNEPENEEDSEQVTQTVNADRKWLIQCKREKSIGPTKLLSYLKSIPQDELGGLHGILFVAACDFSKSSRDKFRSKCSELGLQEAFLIGKAELEDMLFQPKNDHLLFAYFGFSLRLRKQSIRSTLRSRLSIKRKCERILDGAGNPNKLVLLRSPEDDRYPYMPEEPDELKLNPIRWRIFHYEGLHPQGIKLLGEKHFAYISDDCSEWDMVDAVNDARLSLFEDPWHNSAEDAAGLRDRVWRYWLDLQETNRAFYKLVFIVNFDDILDVDEKGDEYAPFPHIYAFLPKQRMTITRVCTPRETKCIDIDQAKRINFFPSSFPEPAPIEAIPVDDPEIDIDT